MKKISFIVFLVYCFSGNYLSAQNLPVGTPVLEEVYRNYQLLGKVDSTISFSIRPLSARALKRKAIFYPDSVSQLRDTLQKKSSWDFSLLPLSLQQQFNSHHPYGWNDGAMIPARGYQQLFSAGFYARFKFLSIQLNPQFVYAENKNFNGFAQANHNATVWQSYYGFYNGIDQPERFGRESYVKFLPGQSNISLTFDPVAISFSNENKWWGPGIRNSLIMSNNATGFRHLSIKTVRPVSTPIGSFESEIIGGRLEDSGYPPLILDEGNSYSSLYSPRDEDWRYLSGLVISYQPKWVPGFTLGFIRAFQLYNQNIGRFSEYLPGFSAKGSKAFQSPLDDDLARDQLASLFMRWHSNRFHTEVYAEYGRNDDPGSFRDLVLQPEHNRAYILGMRRLFPTFRGRTDELLQVGFEMTDVAISRTIQVRATPPWYRHGVVRSGYTNNGEVLGAGIGPGANLQSFNLAWLKGVKKLGIQLERRVHNNDFYYEAFGPGPNIDIRKYWVDLGIMASGSWDFKKLLVNAQLGLIQSLNYNWELHPGPDPSVYWIPGHDVTNFHAQVGLGYRF